MLLVDLHQVGVEAEVLEAEHDVGLVEDPHDDLLAVDGGQRGHAEVDRPVPDGEREPAVLGQAVLGDVEVGHDLETRWSPPTAMASGAVEMSWRTPSMR